MPVKNKTIATALALFTGVFGGHRFYLYGISDSLAWFLPVPTALGLYGLDRISNLGQDDILSWLLLPLLGFCFAAAALTAIVYGLMPPGKWNAKFNPEYQVLDLDSDPGSSNWLTIGTVVIALIIGTTALMSSFAFGFQRYFEYQIIEAQKLSQ